VNQEIGDATAESGFCFLRSVAYTGGMGSKPAVPVLQPAPRNLMFPPVMGRQTGSTGILAVRWKLHCTKSGMMHYLRAVWWCITSGWFPCWLLPQMSSISSLRCRWVSLGMHSG